MYNLYHGRVCVCVCVCVWELLSDCPLCNKVSRMIGSEQYQLLKLSLSASMVAECVNDVVGDTCQLKGKCEDSVTHSVATDTRIHVTDIV